MREQRTHSSKGLDAKVFQREPGGKRTGWTYTQKGEIRNSRAFDGWQRACAFKDAWALYRRLVSFLTQSSGWPSGKDTAKHTFDLIEEFSMIRENQFLIYRGTSEITTDQSAVTADVYCHYGESVYSHLLLCGCEWTIISGGEYASDGDPHAGGVISDGTESEYSSDYDRPA